MAETNTTPNSQKALSLESFEEASKLLLTKEEAKSFATKEDVKEQIADAVGSIADIAFATTEEVLALFQNKSNETPEGEA